MGATVFPGGVNFSVFSHGAAAVDLLLFDREDDPRPLRVIPFDPLANRTYHYWRMFVPGLRPGQQIQISADIDQPEHVRLAAKRLRELSATIGPDLVDADWHRRRELIRTLVQKVEIGKDNVRIVFRVLPDAGKSGPESIAVTLPR